MHQPTITPPVFDATPEEVPTLQSPKLSYDLGETCFINAGVHDRRGKPIRSPGRVLAAVDIPNFVPRQYLIQLFDAEWIHLETRSAEFMAPDRETDFPYARTHYLTPTSAGKNTSATNRTWAGGPQ